MEFTREPDPKDVRALLHMVRKIPHKVYQLFKVDEYGRAFPLSVPIQRKAMANGAFGSNGPARAWDHHCS